MCFAEITTPRTVNGDEKTPGKRVYKTMVHVSSLTARRTFLRNVCLMRDWLSSHEGPGDLRQMTFDRMSDHKEAGKSPDSMIKIMSAVDKVACFHPELPLLLKDAKVQLVLSQYRAWWTQHCKKERYHFALQEVKQLAKVDTRAIRKDAWTTFVWLSWTFALRMGEAMSVHPSHIGYDRTEKRWTCLVVRPKIGYIHQSVSVSVDDVDAEAQQVLRTWVMDQGSWPKEGWNYFIRYNKVVNRILKRYAVSTVLTVVHHSFRHGRITYLLKIRGWGESKLAPFGRWKSRSSMLVYFHASMSLIGYEEDEDEIEMDDVRESV